MRALPSRWRMVAWNGCFQLINCFIREWLHRATTICHNAVAADNDDAKMQSNVFRHKACASLECPPHHTTTICHKPVGADNDEVKMQSCVFQKKRLRISRLSHHTTTFSQKAAGTDNDDDKMQSCVFKKKEVIVQHWNAPPHDDHLGTVRNGGGDENTVLCIQLELVAVTRVTMVGLCYLPEAHCSYSHETTLHQ